LTADPEGAELGDHAVGSDRALIMVRAKFADQGDAGVVQLAGRGVDEPDGLVRPNRYGGHRVRPLDRDLLKRTGSGSPAISRRGSRGDASGPQKISRT
jgi:hypothetical protein